MENNAQSHTEWNVATLKYFKHILLINIIIIVIKNTRQQS